MDILIMSWEYPPRIIGGISRVVYDLSQSLTKLGHNIHILTCWESGTKEYEVDNNISIHRVHVYNNASDNFVEWVMQLNFAMLECAITLAKKNNFDIIHAHDWLVSYAAIVLKRSFSIPLISTIHATEYGRNNGIHTTMQITISNVENWLVNESNKIIVNSKYMKNEVKSIFNVDQDKITIINNGIDLNKFNNVYVDSSFRNNYAAPNERIVLFVGRLVSEKGVNVLIDAIPRILYNYMDVKFIIAGTGPCLNNLKDQAGSLNVLNKIYFTDFVSEEVLLKLYKCSDIAVFPSTYEPFGIVALEGMVAGTPVVVSDIGGFSEIVNNREDGMKFQSGSSDSLADCIIELLKNRDLSDNISREALRKVHRLYNWDNITRKVLEEYKYVIL